MGSLSLLQENLLNPGTEPRSPVLQADSLQAEPDSKYNELGTEVPLKLLTPIFCSNILSVQILQKFLYHSYYLS